MAAFDHNTFVQLTDNLKELYRRRRAINDLALSVDDFLSLFVPAEQRDLFKMIQAEQGGVASLTWRTGLAEGDVKISTLIGSQTIPVPRCCALQPDAPPELVERVTLWLRNGGDVPRDFGRANYVLNYLNENYSKSGVRFMWPSIMALAEVSDVTKEVGAKLQTANLRAPPNPLPRNLAVMCRLSSETVASASLLSETITGPSIDYKSVIVLRPSSSEAYHEGGCAFYAIG